MSFFSYFLSSHSLYLSGWLEKAFHVQHTVSMIHTCYSFDSHFVQNIVIASNSGVVPIRKYPDK